MSNLAVDQSDDYGLSDNPHIQIMFDALDDTAAQAVAGNESFNLTQAQVYARSVISANDVSYGSRDGNEGFFESVGKGLKEVWTYIKKMFSDLWGFFFTKSAPAALDKAEAEVKDLIQDLNKIGQGSDAELKEHLNRQEKALERIADSAEGSEKSQVEGLLQRTKRARAKDATTSEVKEVVLLLTHEAPKFNEAAKADFQKAMSRIIGKAGQWLEFHEHFKTEALKGGKQGGVVYDALAPMNSFIAASKKFHDQMMEVKDLTDLNKAKSVAQAMINDIGDCKKALKEVQSQKAELQKEIDKVDAMAKKVEGEGNSEAAKEIRNEVAPLRQLMTYFSRFAKYIKECPDDIYKLKKATEAAFFL